MKLFHLLTLWKDNKSRSPKCQMCITAGALFHLIRVRMDVYMCPSATRARCWLHIYQSVFPYSIIKARSQTYLTPKLSNKCTCLNFNLHQMFIFYSLIVINLALILQKNENCVNLYLSFFNSKSINTVSTAYKIFIFKFMGSRPNLSLSSNYFAIMKIINTKVS